MTYGLSDDMFGRSIIASNDPFPEAWPYESGNDVRPKFESVATAILHTWSLDSFQDETSGDAQYGNGWHALFRSERAILQAVSSGACYAWRVPDNEDIDAVWEKIEAGSVYPDDQED